MSIKDRQHPSMVDRREDEGGSQARLAQMSQSLKERAEPSLVSLGDVVIPIVGALLDQPPSVGGEKTVIVAEIEPLRVPLGMVGR